MSQRHLLPLQYKIISVTEKADRLFCDFEQAVLRLGAAEGEEEVDQAYGALCQRRREIYVYLQELEKAAKLPRNVKKRFL